MKLCEHCQKALSKEKLRNRFCNSSCAAKFNRPKISKEEEKIAYNSYMKEYMLKRFDKRMIEAKAKLGNKCAKCPAGENLQFDHIDPATKKFTLAGPQWNVSQETFDKELAKCQLLCTKCHIEKTAVDMNKPLVKDFHGTLSSYKYCKCALCRKAKADYTREYRIKNPRKT